ncbi:hypothetical protein FISHEDRAFT_48593 [Fistulina hepatica ATCC 64428]|uniref:Uncharacterized protein n=1 Tax=Fistulina hepatica ATCC 64428 TaxID=1128425 RepID=A0A0D7A752_9AGAR|nr:hypothetical protein FISHEDRAFT_48593 [Fistulina hepatica ATCC 64428]
MSSDSLGTHPQHLFGLRPESDAFNKFVASLVVRKGIAAARPDIKVYSDAVYYNYYALGISFTSKPDKGYVPKSSSIDPWRLYLDSVDFYNVPSAPRASSSRPTEKAFSTYVMLPLSLQLTPDIKDKEGKVMERLSSVVIENDSTGKYFVSSFGEPDRKGGGAGPSNGSVGIWCEWTRDGVMVEFAGDDARGPQAWERGKDAVWKVITIFKPS